MPTLGENRCARWMARRRKGLRPHGKSQRKYCRRLGTSSCRRAFDTPSKRRQLPGNLILNRGLRRKADSLKSEILKWMAGEGVLASELQKCLLLMSTVPANG